MKNQESEICRECSGLGFIQMDPAECFGETNRKACRDCWGRGIIEPDADDGDAGAEADLWNTFGGEA